MDKRSDSSEQKFGYYNSLPVVITELERRYRQILNEKAEKRLFLKIAEYGKYLVETGLHPEYFLPLFQQAKADAELYKKASMRFMKRWSKLANDLLNRAEQANVKDHPQNILQSPIPLLQTRLNNAELSFYSEEIKSCYSPYVRLLEKCRAEKVFEILIPNHIKKEDGTPVLADDYLSALHAWEKYKQHREISTWWAHYNIMRLTHGVYDLKDKRQYLKVDDAVDGLYAYEFKEVAKGNASGLIILKSWRFLEWIDTVHSFLIPRLKQVVDKPISHREELKTSQTATRRGLEKKRDVLQAIWTVYEGMSRPNAVLVPVAALAIKGRTVEFIDGVIDGISREGGFNKWERKERYYDIVEIDHDRLPQIFEKTGESYQRLATEYQRGIEVNIEAGSIDTHNRPFCLSDEGIGYLKFGKHGKKVKIGRVTSQPFKLLVCLTQPHFGVQKTIDIVFESLRENLRKRNLGEYTTPPNRQKKFDLIHHSAIKELQKENKFRGKVKVAWDDMKSKMWLEYIG
jgi:hypothetical protein